jgi:hypothetical protein
MGAYELMGGVGGGSPVVVNGRAVWRAMRAGGLYLYYGSNRHWYIGNGASMRRGKTVGVGGVCVSSDASGSSIRHCIGLCSLFGGGLA